MLPTLLRHLGNWAYHIFPSTWNLFKELFETRTHHTVVNAARHSDPVSVTKIQTPSNLMGKISRGTNPCYA